MSDYFCPPKTHKSTQLSLGVPRSSAETRGCPQVQVVACVPLPMLRSTCIDWFLLLGMKLSAASLRPGLGRFVSKSCELFNDVQSNRLHMEPENGRFRKTQPRGCHGLATGLTHSKHSNKAIRIGQSAQPGHASGYAHPSSQVRTFNCRAEHSTVC